MASYTTSPSCSPDLPYVTVGLIGDSHSKLLYKCDFGPRVETILIERNNSRDFFASLTDYEARIIKAYEDNPLLEAIIISYGSCDLCYPIVDFESISLPMANMMDIVARRYSSLPFFFPVGSKGKRIAD